MFAALAAKYPIAFVPFLLDHVALKPELMQADGLHPNALGQPQLLENLWPKLKPLLEAGDLLVDGGNEHFTITERRASGIEASAKSACASSASNRGSPGRTTSPVP